MARKKTVMCPVQKPFIGSNGVIFCDNAIVFIRLFYSLAVLSTEFDSIIHNSKTLNVWNICNTYQKSFDLLGLQHARLNILHNVQIIRCAPLRNPGSATITQLEIYINRVEIHDIIG